MNKILGKFNSFHFYSKTNHEINGLRTSFHNYHIACYLNAYASYFDLILLDNFNEDNLKAFKCRIKEKATNYEQVYSKCVDWISNKLDSATGRTISPMFKGINDFYANFLKKAPFEISKIYSNNNENYLSKDEQLKRLEQDAKSGIDVFIESISNIQLLNNSSVDMYLDSNNVYISEGE